MTAPIMIADTPSGFHLADHDSDTAYCGEEFIRGLTFTLGPGSDFGEHERDCPKCLAKWRKAGG